MLAEQNPSRSETPAILITPDLRAESGDREDSIRKDLALRLQRVCEKLPAEEFEALVMKMTREQLRGEGLMGRRVPSG
jgi:hypothetical protein